MAKAAVLEKALARIESAQVLDGPAEKVAAIVRTLVRPGPIEDTLSGTAVGHPVHPAVVAVPIGAWTTAGIFDVLGKRDAARTAVGIGVLSAVPALATGASDWLSTAGAERRVGLVHAVANYVAVGSYALSWFLRRGGGRGYVSAGVGGAALAFSGWLGGHLAYAQGVGVDTTAFLSFPAEWTAAGDVPTGAGPHNVSVDGVAVLVARVDDGWVALADRCTHRGAPLHEGQLEDGCITCPWHGSAFELRTGQVTSGPATRPQPVLEVREAGGQLQVRRAEERALRINPV